MAPPPPKSRARVSRKITKTAVRKPCELSRSLWDILMDLLISDPQMDDEMVDEFLRRFTSRPFIQGSIEMGTGPLCHAMGAVGAGAVDGEGPPSATRGSSDEGTEEFGCKQGGSSAADGSPTNH
ncbi:hypothetical protein EJB05_13519, partial [Eragrostis curvula]